MKRLNLLLFVLLLALPVARTASAQTDDVAQTTMQIDDDVGQDSADGLSTLQTMDNDQDTDKTFAVEVGLGVLPSPRRTEPLVTTAAVERNEGIPAVLIRARHTGRARLVKAP